MTVDVFALTLPMTQSFATAGGVVGSAAQGAPHVYVRVTDTEGVAGWGEARPSPRWSYETQESVVTTIASYLRPALLNQPVGDLHGLLSRMDREIAAGYSAGQPIAKAAVDMALHDLLGQRLGVSLGELWLGSRAPGVSLSYLISTRDPEEAAKRAARAMLEGYTGLDVKIGLSWREDVEIVAAVRAAAPGLFLRVDANQGYDLADATRIAPQLAAFGVDVWEQPLPAGALHETAAVRRKSQVPIALDESIWSAGDVLAAIRAEACDVVVVKLTKMGGLAGARRAGEMARAAHLGLLGGGLTESRLGLAASAHLFHYLGIRDPVDLNGPLFLADDPVAVGPMIDAGEVHLLDLPGMGCRIDETKLRTYESTGG